MQRISTLDGWRGIAILMVLLSHAAFQSRFSQRPWAQHGWTGVDIFFVISGYIITTSLLQHGDRFSLAGFYRRRAYRILPPVLLYITGLALLSSLGLVKSVSRSELLGSLFFIRNYQIAVHPGGGTYTGHFWSLAIEEHFYLLWPTLLYLVRERRALWIATGGAILSALWRAYCCSAAATGSKSLYFIVIRTDCRMDGLLIGCALAFLLRNPSIRIWVRRNFPKESPLLCAFPALLLIAHLNGLPSLWLYTLIAIALASTLLVEEGLAYKWLNLPPLVWIGRISYGLYVYQEIFLMHPLGSAHVPLWQSFPINICLTFCVAVASFYLVERPLTRLAQNRSRTPAQTPRDDAESLPSSAPVAS